MRIPSGGPKVLIAIVAVVCVGDALYKRDDRLFGGLTTGEPPAPGEGWDLEIAAYLVSRGIDPARVVAKGNGSSHPVASNETPEVGARNRRTDILFIPAAHAQP